LHEGKHLFNGVENVLQEGKWLSSRLEMRVWKVIGLCGSLQVVDMPIVVGIMFAMFVI
jgi:hypothetical protein